VNGDLKPRLAARRTAMRIAYGPGRLETAHRSNEHVAVSDLMSATKVMALATLRLLGSAS
jgi:acetylornithine deacetylase/succinyl-diaminopimelate desuccinylase-like protein